MLQWERLSLFSLMSPISFILIRIPWEQPLSLFSLVHFISILSSIVLIHIIHQLHHFSLLSNTTFYYLHRFSSLSSTTYYYLI